MFLKRALSFRPHFQATSAWHLHKAFACELIFRLKPKCFVELGVHHGDSYFTFCQAVKENNLSTICYGIDHWEGDQHAGEYSKDVYEKVISHNYLNYSNFSYLIKDNFKNASKQFLDQSIDLCHIDGNHTLECVSEDWKTWKPKIRKDGILLFHDILEKKAGFGVWELWERLKNVYPSFTFKFGSGLGVLQLSKNSNDVTINNDFVLERKEEENINKLFLFCNKTKIFNLEREIGDLTQMIEDLTHTNQILFDQNYHLKAVSKNELKLQSQINSLSSSLDFAYAKCDQFRTSFSWKITMPLRFLRRKIIDPFRRITKDKILGSKSYYDWISLYDSESIAEKKSRLKYNENNEKTKFSIILPVYDPPVNLLAECIDSVIAQIYKNWELCIVDDCSKNPVILNLIQNYARMDSRIRFQSNKKNRHISLTSNRACSFATGDYFVFWIMMIFSESTAFLSVILL